MAYSVVLHCDCVRCNMMNIGWRNDPQAINETYVTDVRGWKIDGDKHYCCYCHDQSVAHEEHAKKMGLRGQR